MDRKPLRVLLRCDAGPRIGGGHVMRCLTLAEELRGAGTTCLFACSTQTAETVPQLLQSEFDILWLADPLDPAVLEAGLAERPAGRLDAILVDHYGLDATQEQAFRALASTIAVIDDLADRPHDCDLLLDQTFGRDARHYLGLTPAHAQILCGAGFALLRPAFAQLRAASLARRRGDPVVRRVLVMLGMTDVGGTTRKVVQAMLASTAQMEIDVAVGAGITDLDALRALVDNLPNVHLHVATLDMAELMNRADAAVGAAGTSTWERCCLGLPTIMLAMADNQRLIASRLDALGAAEVVDLDRLEGIAGKIEALAGDPERLLRMSKLAASVTDGQGGRKVALALIKAAAKEPPRPGRPLGIRPAEARDRVDVWLWRNHLTARRFSADEGAIPFAGHATWWDAKLRDPRTVLLIMEADGRSVGQVRFDIDATQAHATVSIALAPAFHGMGYGASGLSQAIAFYYDRLRNAGPLFADIRRDNVASVRIFGRCGFESAGESGEFNRYRRDPRSADASARVLDT